MAKKKDREEVEAAIQINEQLCKLDCVVTSDLESLTAPYTLTTGLLSLDLILSTFGGFTMGCSEIYGKEGVGKSSLALSVMTEAQRIGMKCFYINMERGVHRGTIECFKELDPDRISWVAPAHGQAAINAIEAILRTVPKSFIVLDSIPACISAAQLDGAAEDSHMAVIPRMLSAFMPKARILTSSGQSHVMFLNQIRDNLKSPHGGKITPGGHAIKFYSDWRIELSLQYPNPYIEKKGDTIGQKIKAETVKNRYLKPFQTAIFPLMYGHGFDHGLELTELGLQFGFIKKGGAWFNLDDCVEKFQGELQMAAFLNENAKERQVLETKIRTLFK